MSQNSPNPLDRKLFGGVVFNDADKRISADWFESAVEIAAKEIVVAQGERNRTVYIVVSGWACRFKEMPGRGRPIIGFLLPGDHVSGHERLDFEFDHGVRALSPCRIAEITRDDFERAKTESPVLAGALERAQLIDEAIGREWLAGFGRGSAEQRTARLICELFHRLEAVGLNEARGYRLPLTQAILSDALGLSAAHLNRTLQALRIRNLVRFENGLLEIPSADRLEKFASFDARYLRLNPHNPTQDG